MSAGLPGALIFAEGFKLAVKCRTKDGGQGIQMEIAFSRVKKEGVIGDDQVERGQEAECEGLSEGGSDGDENQCE